MTALGHLAGDRYSNANGVSDDGKVVVGQSSGNDSVGIDWTNAFRWEGGKMVGFGNLQRGLYNSAQGVSADGSVAVGKDASSGQAAIFKDGNMMLIGSLPGGWFAEANAVSANGQVVVGISNYAGGQQQQGFRWEAGQMTAIGGAGLLVFLLMVG